jgi:hypothetical protein
MPIQMFSAQTKYDLLRFCDPTLINNYIARVLFDFCQLLVFYSSYSVVTAFDVYEVDHYDATNNTRPPSIF